MAPSCLLEHVQRHHRPGNRDPQAGTKPTRRTTGHSRTRRHHPRGAASSTHPAPGSGLLGLPEDLVDLLDLGQQVVGLGHARAALGAGGASQLGGLVEQRVQLRVLLEVRRLEVVGPQHPQVVLDQLRTLFLDDYATLPELRVRVLLVLLNDGLDRFGLDPRLRRVIDSAGQVAVGAGHGLRLEQACEQPHRSPFSDWFPCRADTTPTPFPYTGEGYQMHWPLTRVAVAERSMEPALRPGDWLLVRRTRRVRAGQIVLARHPARPDLLIVKRAARRVDGGWWLESDNPDAGAVDSRRFGAVPAALIEGRVLARYWRPHPG